MYKIFYTEHIKVPITKMDLPDFHHIKEVRALRYWQNKSSKGRIKVRKIKIA